MTPANLSPRQVSSTTVPETWISADETLAVTGWTPRRLQMLCKEGRVTWREVVGSSHSNGKPEREVLPRSLPAAAQMKYAEQHARAVVQKDVERAAPLFAGVPDALPAVRAAPDAESDAQAKARFAAIEPLLEFRAKTNGTRPTFHASGGRKITNTNELAEYVAAQQKPPVCSRTLWKWLRRFRESGYQALADPPRKDKGQSRFFAKHEAAACFVKAKYLGEGLGNVRLVHEALVRDWANVEKRGEPPSYATVASFIDSLPRPQVTLAHEGREALHARHSLAILRRAPPAMDCWISDHRKFDVVVRNTMFSHLDFNESFRPWLTAVYDWGSRALVGVCFSANPCSDTINSALRMALGKFGFPRRFYWDNGEDFKAVKRHLEKFSMPDGTRGLFAQREVFFDVASALPKAPRSKPIEAYFTRWARQFCVLWRGAYLGNRPGSKPELTREAEAQHAKFLTGKASGTPLPTDREFIACACEWAAQYNESAHLDCLDGRTPSDVLDEQFPPEHRTPAPAEIMMSLLLKDDVRTVLAGGSVEINKMRYEPAPESVGVLYQLQERKVRILRDPYDFSFAFAADLDSGVIIGKLLLQIPLEPFSENPQTNEELKRRMRDQRAQNRLARNSIGAILAGASAFGWRTERQVLLDAAVRRNGTDGAVIAAAAPGARQPRRIAENSAGPALAPAFVSDFVENNPIDLDHLELED